MMQKKCAWLPVCHLQTPPKYRWPPWMAYEEPCIFPVLYTYIHIYRYIICICMYTGSHYDVSVYFWSVRHGWEGITVIFLCKPNISKGSNVISESPKIGIYDMIQMVRLFIFFFRLLLGVCVDALGLFFFLTSLRGYI